MISVDGPTKGLKIQGQSEKRHSAAREFWSSSACEMDNSTFPSQRSLSSMSTSNQTSDLHSNAGSTSDPHEFVNHGKDTLTNFHSLSTSLYLWNRTRQQWTANKDSPKQKQVREPVLGSSATYESLLGTNKPFLQPIPLPEMVDFLVDVWEQEGLYD